MSDDKLAEKLVELNRAIGNLIDYLGTVEEVPTTEENKSICCDDAIEHGRCKKCKEHAE